jgi:hypothetical protein
MTTTTMADADVDADAPRQLQQQQQLPQQQQRNGKRWGVSTSKDVHGTGVGCISRKQRPRQRRQRRSWRHCPLRRQVRRGPRRGGASPPPPPLPPRAIDSSGGAARQGALLPGAAWGRHISCLLRAIFFPVASGSQRVCRNGTRVLGRVMRQNFDSENNPVSPIHSLCVGWRNLPTLRVGWRDLFFSCAVVSVFGSGGK